MSGVSQAAEPDPAFSGASLDIDIMQETGEWPVELQACIRLAAATAYQAAGSAEDAEMCIVLADDEFVRALNKTYRGQDKPTNVLSFPAGALPAGVTMPVRPLGDVVLACETISREAAEQNKVFADHLSHLVVHGVLHLLGHDHETDAEAEAMEALERGILSTLDISDPYASIREQDV